MAIDRVVQECVAPDLAAALGPAFRKVPPREFALPCTRPWRRCPPKSNASTASCKRNGPTPGPLVQNPNGKPATGTSSSTTITVTHTALKGAVMNSFH